MHSYFENAIQVHNLLFKNLDPPLHNVEFLIKFQGLWKTMYYAVVIYSAFFYTNRGKERCCDHVGCFTNDYPFDSLPLPQCEDKIQASMRLYTRSNPKVGQVVTRTTIP